jgi:hypothetical protein
LADAAPVLAYFMLEVDNLDVVGRAKPIGSTRLTTRPSWLTRLRR